MKLEQRIEALEKRVAELEGSVQEQPLEKKNLETFFKFYEYVKANKFYRELCDLERKFLYDIIKTEIMSTVLSGKSLEFLRPNHLERAKYIADEAIHIYRSKAL